MAIFYNPNRKKGLFYIPSGATGGSVSAPLSIEYSANAFCEDGIDPTPTVSNNVGAGTFSSTAGLVFISTSTGEVDLSASTSGATYLITYTDTNSATATFSLTVNALDDASFAYSQSSYAPTDADPTPTITGVTGGTFSAGSGLVFVDSGSNTGSSTGEIDLSASTIASYTITYTTAGTCPNTSTQTVEIAAALAQVSNVYSMSFNGVNDFINISNPTELTNDFTISAWILPTRVNNSYEMIYTQGTPYFAIRDTRLHFYFTSSYETGLNFITANEWQHVAVTRTSGVLNLYRNGVEYNGTRPTQNGTINNDSDGIIGKWFNNSHYFKGKIDEVAIFNTSLTAQEVQSIYNATETGKTADLNDLTTPPVKRYRMGD